VEVESLEIVVVSSLVVKGEQIVLWSDESEHWSELRLFMKLPTLSTTTKAGSLLRKV